MSQALSASSIEVLFIAGRAVALLLGFGVLAWAFSQWRSAAINDAQRVFDQLDLVRADLLIMKEAMNHASSESQGQIPGQIQSQIRSRTPSQRYQDEARLPSAAASMSNARGYEIAVRMARSGAHKDELIRSCGITSHEADLLIKLHRRDSLPVPTNRIAANAAGAPSANRGARSDALGQRIDQELEHEVMPAALSKEAALKSRAPKSRLMAIG